MFLISAEKFSLWKKKQISKGGDNHSLNLLIDSLGGLSNIELNLLKIKSEKVLNLNLDLDFIETLWDKHLNTSIPIQYLSGISFWRDLKLEVSNKILIPRPETELFIDIVSGIFKNKKEKITFVDLGTGSGAISIALALANPNWSGIATDIDKSAIEIASRNFKTNSNQSNLKFYNGNWWDPLENFKGEIDFAVANPPYIPQDTYEVLPIEVKNFEPKLALLGGKEGLDHINQIVQNAPLYLKNKGWLLIENHFDQGEKVK
ncbi:HemK/PrmC family methyltransferase, partial [uncultured Prochlorococcus sp.]|uniref:HemK/PrmC family methyltransferase n=1 Tax=uncultured Prochlorococcus sp. TaxID=159733 RepID=UPI002582571B